jgi:DNA-binding NarL/FixJ family response regulator
MRILCVDDHVVVREGLAAILGTQPDIEIVGMTSNGADAVDTYRQSHPDVVLMDLRMPGMSGLDAIRAIRGEDPGARIIVLTMYSGEDDVRRAIEAGASAYLAKDTLADDLVRTLRRVHAAPAPVGRAVDPPRVAELTPREMEVMQGLARGLRNKEIAADLGVTSNTVHMHIKNIFFKFDVHDRTAALATAIRRGIVHLDD